MSLEIEVIRSEIEDDEEDISVYKIRYYPADYTLHGLYDKWKAGEIYVPEFQRKFVWNIKQASSLIESFLLGLPVPPVFLYREVDTQKLLIIDGQQRLRSIFGYFDEEFPDTLKRFSLRKVKTRWDGLTISQLSSVDRIRLTDSVLRALIVEQIDPKDDTSMYHIFQRLNTGGTTLRPQEIRNALYHGAFSKFLKELNEIEPWRVLIGAPQPDNRGRDIELILRVMALAEMGDSYFKPMKDFLTSFMKKNNNATERFQRFREAFEGGVIAVLDSLGPKPFHIRRGLNAAAYDCTMVAFYKHQKKIPKDIQRRYRELLENESFNNYISSATTDVDTVKQRIMFAEQKLFNSK